MNDLVNKANSIEEDIKGMPILEQIRYAANLYQEMNEVRGEEMGDMNVFIKAQTNVECVWRCLAAEYKGAMVKELESELQRHPIAVSLRRWGTKVLVRSLWPFLSSMSQRLSSNGIQFFESDCINTLRTDMGIRRCMR